MAVLLNVGSLLLALIAWLLPIINLLKHEKHTHKRWVSLSVISLSACAIALCFQIFYSYHLVKIEDWSALMDITGSVAYAATVLLVVTILLNTMTLVIYHGQTAK